MKINNTEYAYGDIEVTLFGQPVMGLTGISYKSSQATDYVRGAGNEPQGIQKGQKSYEGTLTILQSELEALNRTAQAKGYDSIVGVPMDITVTYSNSLILTIDYIRCAVISEIEKGQKQGDLHSEHALAFKALGINYNVAA